MTAALVQSLVVKNPSETLSKFIPWLHRNLMTIVRENPEVLEDQFATDCEIQWNMTLLCYLISAGGADLLPWIPKVKDIIAIANQLKEITGIRLSTKLYTCFVHSLGTIHIYRRDHRAAVLR